MRIARALPVPVLVATMAIAATVPGAAGAAGTFTCQATGLSGSQASVANSANDPCAPDQKTSAGETPVPGVIGLGSPLVSSSDLRVGITDTRTTNRSAVSNVGEIDWVSDEGALVNLPPLAVLIDSAFAFASVGCEAGTPTLSGGSSVAFVEPGLIQIADPLDLPLGGGLTLHLNSRRTTAQETVVRAIWIETPGGGDADDLIVSEARAGVTGNPCA